MVTILTIVVGILGLAYVKNVDTSCEALRVLAEARKALQHCEDTNWKAALEAPVPTFQSGTLRMIAVAPAPTFQDAQHKITVDASYLGRRIGAAASSRPGNGPGLKPRDSGSRFAVVWWP